MKNSIMEHLLKKLVCYYTLQLVARNRLKRITLTDGSACLNAVEGEYNT